MKGYKIPLRGESESNRVYARLDDPTNVSWEHPRPSDLPHVPHGDKEKTPLARGDMLCNLQDCHRGGFVPQWWKSICQMRVMGNE